jgi:hypothetical protein
MASATILDSICELAVLSVNGRPDMPAATVVVTQLGTQLRRLRRLSGDLPRPGLAKGAF